MREDENKNKSIYLPTARESVRECVKELTGLNSSTITKISKGTAIGYLECYFPDTFPHNKKKWIEYLDESPMFWAWWDKHWEDRDLEFINGIDEMVLGEPLYFYSQKHDIQLIVNRLRVPGRVMNSCKIKTKK